MTIFFPDVSQYDQVDIQPGTVVVVARATLSDRVADPRYQLFQAEAARVGAFFVAYHWLNHGNIAAQAQWCYQHVGATPLMIDAEDLAGNTGYDGPLTVADILAFTMAYRALGGVVHLVYLPEWYWAADMNRADLTPLVAAGLHLVASDYTAYSDTGPGWTAYGAMSPDEWQYTDALPYGGGAVDFNAYRGTVAQFIRIATAAQEDTMTVLLTIVRPDGSARSGPTDGLGNFHWIPTAAALQEFQQATGLPIRTIPEALARDAYGVILDPPAPVAGTLTADEVRAVLKQELAAVLNAGAQAA